MSEVELNPNIKMCKDCGNPCWPGQLGTILTPDGPLCYGCVMGRCNGKRQPDDTFGPIKREDYWAKEDTI